MNLQKFYDFFRGTEEERRKPFSWAKFLGTALLLTAVGTGVGYNVIGKASRQVPVSSARVTPAILDNRENIVKNTTRRLEEDNRENELEKEMESNRLSSNGLNFIKSFEGFSPVVYLCPAGKRTIAYGHVVKKQERFDRITEPQGEAILSQDAKFAEEAINKYVKVPLSPNQYDALCSFVYNVGGGNFRTSTLLRNLNLGDYQAASQEFKKWVKVGGKKLNGLETRREEERKLFLNN